MLVEVGGVIVVVQPALVALRGHHHSETEYMYKMYKFIDKLINQCSFITGVTILRTIVRTK